MQQNILQSLTFVPENVLFERKQTQKPIPSKQLSLISGWSTASIQLHCWAKPLNKSIRWSAIYINLCSTLNRANILLWWWTFKCTDQCSPPICETGQAVAFSLMSGYWNGGYHWLNYYFFFNLPTFLVRSWSDGHNSSSKARFLYSP